MSLLIDIAMLTAREGEKNRSSPIPRRPCASPTCMTDLDHARLNQTIRYILDGPHLSVLSTVNADGTPQTSVIFVKQDGDHLLVSTIKGRKTINMIRDPRATLLIHGLPTDRPSRAGD